MTPRSFRRCDAAPPEQLNSRRAGEGKKQCCSRTLLSSSLSLWRQKRYLPSPTEAKKRFVFPRRKRESPFHPFPLLLPTLPVPTPRAGGHSLLIRRSERTSPKLPTKERGVKLHSVRDSAKKEPLPTFRVCRNVPRKSSPPPPVSSIKLKGKIENVVAKSSSQRRVFGSFTVSSDHLLVICKFFPHHLAIKISWRFRVKNLANFQSSTKEAVISLPLNGRGREGENRKESQREGERTLLKKETEGKRRTTQPS